MRIAESPNLTYFNEFYRRFLEFDMFWNFFPFWKDHYFRAFQNALRVFCSFPKERYKKDHSKMLFSRAQKHDKSRHVINDHFLSNDPKSRSQSTLLWSIHVYFALFLEYFVNMLFFWSIHVYFALFLPIICNALYF